MWYAATMNRQHIIVRGVIGLICMTLLALGGCARDTTILLVRHAERGPGQDPALTPAGLQRANALRDAVARSGVSAIFVSNFQRTQQTAAPTAQLLGLTPIVVPISGTASAQAADIASRITNTFAGSRVLVVGHSDTLPLIMAQLGVTNPPAIAESDFNRFFLVIRRSNAETRFIEVKYGQ